MNAALVGLIGVITGGFLTGGFQLWMRHRVERADGRVAARLVLHDLFVVVETLPLRHRFESTRPERYEFSEAMATWREHRTTLARVLTNSEWDDVANAIQLMGGIHGSRAGEVGRPTQHALDSGWSPEMLEMGIIDLLYRRLEKATVALERIASGSRHARRVRRELEEEDARQAREDVARDEGEGEAAMG